MEISADTPASNLERGLKERSALDQLGKTLTSNFDLEQLLDAIHHQLTQLLQVENFYVALFEPLRQEIWYPLAVKNGLRQTWPRRPLADRLTDRVILNGQPILIPHHARAHLNQIGLPSPEDNLHAWIGVPLVASQKTTGCLALFSYSPQTEFTEADLRLLTTVSGLMSIAIQVALQNALLSSDLIVGRDRLASVLNSVEEGIIFFEKNGRISLVNSAFEQITRIPQMDILGKLINGLSDPILYQLGFTTEESSKLIQTLTDLDLQITNKTIVKLGDGIQVKYLERSIHPLIEESDQDSGWLLLLRDVSEEQQTRINRDLLSETLIHDLRSPISAVLSAVDVVEDAMNGNDPSGIVKPALQIARRSAQRVLGMVESMLEIARFQAAKIDLHLTKSNLRELVEQTLVEYSRQAIEYEISLLNEVPKDLPPIEVDQTKMIRVLSNLIDNAIKFTPPLGSVQLNAKMVNTQRIEVQVRDTGPGIPEEYLEKIFERFNQIPGQAGRRRGSGLGLTYCRMAVEAHGGQIWVESMVGTGSTFFFTLPIDPEKL
jgi:signal transduction histidine kinase